MILALAALLQAATPASTQPPTPEVPLVGAYDPHNPFARILRGELPAVKVYEDAHVLAFLDHAPQAPGHVLVISKDSTARNLLEMAPEDYDRLMAVVRRIARAEVSALGAQGFTLVENNGAGSSVPHLHIHVIPRMAGVPIFQHATPIVPPEQLEPIAAKLRAALAAQR